jgi:glycosyltransferase involved in cell wall biosynthesis
LNGALRVCVLTTSYPRSPDDVAGAFVAEGVDALREAGVAVAVCSPADFRHFGIAYGDGILQNLKARPWRAALLPLFAAGFARAARRAAGGADVVHAHWIPSGLAAIATGKPYVLQVWGTDVELAGRAPRLARPLLRRARLVVAASPFLAEAAAGLGARGVRVIPNGVELPAVVAAPEDPPHVLYVGRLSEEKGILDFLGATEGLPRVVVGDGPLRARVPESVGFVPHDRLGAYYERAAVVCVPSRREGYGVVAREAMAYGRPVVSTAVGGLRDAVEDDVNGLVVPPREAEALRRAVERLLGDPDLRARLGVEARARAEAAYSRAVATDSLLSAYAEALRRTT